MTIDNGSSDKQAQIEAERKIKIEKAKENWRNNGQLGVTADDHRMIGGSPDFELSQNPGKTLGELWTLEKIQNKLRDRVAFLEKARKKYKKDPKHPDSHWSRDDINWVKSELRVSIPYLKSIGKLPEEFDGFKVNDLPDDPLI